MKCLQMSKSMKVDETEGSTAVIEKYGELSTEFGDVLKDIHGDMIESGDSKDDAADGPTEGEWRLLEAFARELNICMNVERNLVLLWSLLVKLDGMEDVSTHKARSTCRPEEGMRYCDMIKEDIESLLELPATSPSISETLAAYVAVALNCRCLFLALCHTLTGKTLESAALLDMLRSRLEDTVLGAALDEPLGRLHPLFERVVDSMPNRVAQWRCRGLAALCGKAPKLKDQENEGQDAGAVTFPPRVREIPCKPLLFDLAFPCIEPPDFEELLPKGVKGAQGERKRDQAMAALGKVAGGVGSVAGGIGSRLGGLWNRGQQK